MSFVDPLFLFVFIPLLLLVYRQAIPTPRNDAHWGVVLLSVASMIFYVCWERRFLLILLVSIVIHFIAAQAMAHGPDARKKRLLILVLTFNLILLGVFKYSTFAYHTVLDLLGMAGHASTLIRPFGIYLPLGISFFTFTQMAYVVDVYRGASPENRFMPYFLFVTWFPHLMAGPILHHREMIPQFRSLLGSPLHVDHLAVGLTWITLGLFKKVILADGMATLATPLFQDAVTGGSPDMSAAWSGVLAYTLQLYFDFSGYCDMAIGLSFLFGIRLPLNFNSPYKATSIIDFWHRWHITLSRFLRDYLYIPLGGGRVGPGRKYFNLMVVMLLGGLWHGAGWTFIVWGGLHGIYLLINHVWRATPWSGDGLVARLFGRVLTFLAVTFAWTFFRAHDLPSAMRIVYGLMGGNGMERPDAWLNALAQWDWASLVASPWVILVILLAWVWWLPNSQQILAGTEAFLGQKIADSPQLLCWRPNRFFALVCGVLLTVGLIVVISSQERLFLYSQF
ncbi:MAG: MBOAT family protein [Magnetococcus sp. YQC-5]